MKRICIYTEGGFQLGLGHVYRTCSLAKALLAKGNQIRFVTTSEPYICDIIKNRDFEVVKTTSRDEMIKEIINWKTDILILDKLFIEESFVKVLKPYLHKLIIFGNNSTANQYANIVVNAIIGTDHQNKSYFDTFGTLYLEGPKYLVLRDEFYEKAESYLYTGKLDSILLTFGGTDQSNFSYHVLENIMCNKFQGNIKIILGAGYEFNDILKKYLNQISNERIQILKNVNNISEHMIKCDFVLTSPGTTLFEAFLLKIPARSFFQNTNQKEIFGNFYSTGYFNDSSNLFVELQEQYLNYKNYLYNLEAIGAGRGKQEIIEYIGG